MNNKPGKIQRKKRKSYNIVGHAHELTFSCYHQYAYLNNPICCKLFLFDKMCITIGKKKVFRFWQAGGGFDRNLWNPKAIHSSIKYIEENPVRAGLVKNP
jgi:hypothetical protein